MNNAGTLALGRLGSVRIAAAAMGVATIADATLSVPLGVYDNPPALAAATLSSVRAAITAWGLIALLISGACGSGRITRLAQIAAIVGSVLLAPAELIVHWSRPIAGPFYGLAVACLLLGPLWYGTAAIRHGLWTDWRRWTPLLPAVAIALFIVAIAMFGGTGGAPAVGLFVLSYLPLAVALFTRPAPNADGERSSSLDA